MLSSFKGAQITPKMLIPKTNEHLWPENEEEEKSGWSPS